MTDVKGWSCRSIDIFEKRDRFFTLSLFLLLLFIGCLMVISASRTAQAWDTVNLNAIEAPGMYVSAIYGSPYYSLEEYNSSTFSSLNIFYGSSSYEARGYLVFPIGQLDDRTYVADATLKFLAYNNEDTSLRLRILENDPRDFDAETTFMKIHGGVDAGTTSSFNNHLSVTTYFFVFSGSALTSLKEQIAAGGQYLFIGFEATYGAANVICRYSNILGTFHTYLQLTVDASPPEVPVPKALDAYSPGTTLKVEWPAVRDQPGGTTRGGVEYQVGLFDSNTTSDPPYRTSSWNSSLSQTLKYLVDGGTYFLRVRARDASGFESEWSKTVATTMDDSPPSIPVLFSEPTYSPDSTNLIEWWPSTDVGVENITYELEWSSSHDFTDPILFDTKDTNHTVTSLTSRFTYYYRVCAKDGFDHWSGWSAPEASTQDADVPSVPVMLDEPAYTKGTSNVFKWQPAWDNGVGVLQYHVRVATDPVLGPARVVLELNTTLLSVEVDALQDGETYYAQVKAMDAFGYWSVWSDPVNSTQDALPPTVPMMLEEPGYTQGFTNEFWWTPSTDAGAGVAQYRVQVSTNTGVGPPRVVLEVNTTSTSVAVSGLQDGWRYYVRVMAMDALRQWSGWSEPVGSSQDASGPSAPDVSWLPEIVPPGLISLYWIGSIDEMSGLGWYSLVWSQDSTFNMGVRSMDRLSGPYATVSLDIGGRWYFKVVPYDALGNVGSAGSTSTIVDDEPPTAPVLAEPPSFTKGPDTNLSWTASADATSWLAYYLVRVYASEDYHSQVLEMSTVQLNLTVGPLMDGATYRFCVIAFDGVGNGAASNIVSTTIDSSPPPVPEIGYVPPVAAADFTVNWMCRPDGSGRPNEYQVQLFYGSDPVLNVVYPWTTATNQTIMLLADGTTCMLRVVARDPSGWRSAPSAPAIIAIDNGLPSIHLRSPMEGTCVGDVVQVTGAVTDPHLVGYTVSYATGVMSDWIQVASYQVQGNVDGALATWVMLGMPEGFYRVMVAAVDSVGNAANATVSVKRVAANLSLFVSDITFSDPRPEAGDEVTVYVTVHNDGTAGVEGVTLIVMMNGMEILRDKFVMVPAHGRYVAEVRVKAASERMTFAARATSQTHDTGEMVQGAVLVPSEETELSGIASNALVVVALVVAIMAVILAIYLGMRGRRPQEGRV